MSEPGGKITGMETWKQHLDNATDDHLREHDIPAELLARLSDSGRVVMHVGAHEAEGTAR